MARIKLAVDVGGSLTKVVYRLKRDNEEKFSSERYLLFGPQVEKVSKDRFDRYKDSKGSIGKPSIEDDAWLVLSDKYVIVVGSLAREFDPEDRLWEIKYETAIYKVLAAVGMIVNKHLDSKSSEPLQVDLGILLPWNEYSDRFAFAEQLRKLGKSYGFRNGRDLSVNFDSIEARPEGFGLYSTFLHSGQSSILSKGKCGILMLGHRNVSGLFFDRGRLVNGDSPLLGFSVLCDRVVELSSRSDRDRIALALNEVINNLENFYSFVSYKAPDGKPYYRTWKLIKTYPRWEKTRQIQSLCSARDPYLRKEETQRLGETIRIATDEYYEKFSHWLNKIFPEKLDSLVISGGASRFLELLIEKHFKTFEIFTYNFYSSPEIKDIDKCEKIFNGDVNATKDGLLLKIYNHRNLKIEHRNLATSLELSENSPLIDRLLDVYKLCHRL